MRMSRFSLLVFFLSGFVGLGFISLQELTPRTTFQATPGEHLEYRVHYGFINAAEATVDVSDKFHRVKGKACYRVTATGRTTGAFDLVTKVRDSWQSYIDPQTLLPMEFSMRQQEGRYQKEQKVSFDQESDKIVSVSKGKDSKEEVKEFKAPGSIYDVISGYFFLRTVDFNRMKEGQITTVKTFYDNDFINLQIRYAGKEVVKTKFGKLNTHRIIPIMPQNKLFDGKEAIRIWVSDDANKVPVKVEFDLMVGAVAMDLKNYRGMREEFQWQ
ncbi:DUF3108 domain-containing protein [Siphonobacter sp. SORGH_AS_1065]|uniref:DUF3108 domain-containing protein n=1 Tax=Siphonobacter sp. SORGH_AS_1065 TaxID=3041795 RepID=UPI002788B1EF|nr:DUF3108 domain-containing protein [Siphonobacter sp. SORGH_AS_1065]MDQ1086586.1 hypothetical protein [Siphonobacter sp. SORGH_AS_1065]